MVEIARLVVQPSSITTDMEKISLCSFGKPELWRSTNFYCCGVCSQILPSSQSIDFALHKDMATYGIVIPTTTTYTSSGGSGLEYMNRGPCQAGTVSPFQIASHVSDNEASLASPLTSLSGHVASQKMASAGKSRCSILSEQYIPTPETSHTGFVQGDQLRRVHHWG